MTPQQAKDTISEQKDEIQQLRDKLEKAAAIEEGLNKSNNSLRNTIGTISEHLVKKRLGGLA